ncbi:hypothetical protein H0H93_011939 [Arthromyces matolae]|nr:hypothetical protein H0H93_011939 [Arthromyces matolae]
MRLTSLFLLVCLTALSAVAAPLPVSQSQISNNTSKQPNPLPCESDPFLPGDPSSLEPSVCRNAHSIPSSKHQFIPRATLPKSGGHNTASNHAGAVSHTIVNNHAATTSRQSTPAPGSVAPEASSHDHDSHIPSSEPVFPTIPTVQQFMEHMKVPKNKALFWSGRSADDYENKALKRSEHEGWTVIAEAWWDPKKNPKNHGKWAQPWLTGFQHDNSKLKQFWDNASQAFAQLAEGEVHVLLPENVVRHPGTVWDRIEWPALAANKKVTRVIKVTPGKSTKDYAIVLDLKAGKELGPVTQTQLGSEAQHGSTPQGNMSQEV